MKVGDLVTTKSRHFLGVIIRSECGKRANKHYIYWSSPKVEKNPVWVNERHLERAV
jgi:hypothetical protein